MNLFQKEAWKEDPRLLLVCLGMVILPVSNSMGQVPLYAASVMWLVQLIQKKTTWNTSTWIFLGGWMLIILASLFYAVHPELGIRKLSRFLIFPLVGAVTAACISGDDPSKKVLAVCKSIVLGVCILSVYDLIDFPLQVKGGINLVDVGNMTSPQFYLLGMMIWLGLVSLGREKVSKIWWFCLPFLLVGLLMHQKRGVWLASMATMSLWTLWSKKWKTLAVMIFLAGSSLFLPQVRARLGQLREVVQPTHGGRMILWNEVAPRLLPEYPFGIGYNGTKYEDFREILPKEYHMEVGLRHLHNNFLQIRLELGWHGVIWWASWMAWVLWKAFRPSGEGDRYLRGAVAFAFLGLFLNGLVEYNFGDSEILKIYLLLFGLIDVFQPKKTTSEM